MSLLLRGVAWIARLILGALAAVTLCLLLLAAFVSTSWGGGKVAGWVGRVVSKNIQGALEVEEIRLTGFLDFRIEGVRVLDPRGAPVAELPELQVEMDPAPLLAGRLHFRRVLARGLQLEEGGDGRLAEALRPKEPSKEAQQERAFPSAPLPIEVDRLAIEDAAFSVTGADGKERQILIEDIEVIASGWWSRQEGEADVSLSAAAREPLALPLRARTRWRLGEGRLRLLPSELEAGESRADVSAFLEAQSQEGRLEARGSLAPVDLRRFALPFAAPLSFEVQATRGAAAVEVDARLQAPGGGTLRVEGALRDEGALDARLRLFALDPSVWIEGAPGGSFDGEGRVRGALRPEPRLRGEFDLRSGRPAVAATLRGSYEAERLLLEDSRVQIPGGALVAAGAIGREAVDLQATLRIEDLARLRGATAASLGRPLPPARGRGVLRLGAAGPPDALRFSIEGRFPALSVGAGAPALPLRLEAGGKLLPGALELERFSMAHPRGAQRLGGPARVEWGEGRLRLPGLALEQRGAGARAWGERLRGEALLAGGSGRVEASARDFHLEHLPAQFFGGPLLGLRGVVDLDLRAEGPWRRPEGALRLDLRRGAAGPIQDLAARADLRSRGGRVAGTARLAAGGLGRVDAEVDAPLRVDRAPPASELFLRVIAAPVDLAQLGGLLDGQPVAGMLRARLELSGTLGAPLVSLRGRVAALSTPALPHLQPLDLALSAATRDGRVEAEVEGWREGARFAHVAGSAPFDAGAWRRDPRAAAVSLRDAPSLRLQGEVRGLELASLAPLAGWEEIGGRASARFDLRGPARAPLGALEVDLEGGPLGPFRDLDGVFLLRSTETELHCEGRLSAEQQPPLLWSASLGAPVAALLARRLPARTPLSLAWSLQPLQLEALSLVPTLRGSLQTTGALQGSLAALAGEGSLRVEGLELHGEALGAAELRLRAAEAAELALFAVDPTEGFLVARLHLREPGLLPRVVASGLAALRESEGRVELQAEELSLRPLVLVGPLGHVEGALSASLVAEGKLGALLPTGEVALRRGAFEVAGGVRYDRVEFDTFWERDRMRLQLLEAHAGKGLATARGELRYGAPAGFDLQLRADALPVGGSGGALGALSTRGTVRGGLDREAGLDARIELAQTRFDLAPLQSRNLETPGRIEDVLVVTGPQAARRRARARRREAPSVFPVHVALALSDPLRVQGPDLSLVAEVGLDVRRQGPGPFLATGAVRVQEGSASLLGRPFVIQPGTVSWNGGPVDNPALKLTARYDAIQAVAWIDVTGTARQPQVNLRSEPPMSDAQIAQLIATGRTQAAPGPAEGQPAGAPSSAREQQVAAGGAAASLLGSVAATALQQRLAPSLPIDVIAVESTEESTAIEAGTYVGRRLFFGYARNLLPQPGENTNEVRVGYQLSRSVAVQSRFGDAGNGGVDLVFQREFPTGAQKRARAEAGREEDDEDREDEGASEGEGAPPPEA